MKSLRFILVSVLAMAALPPLAAAQQPSSGSVLLAVTVRDKHGDLAPSANPADFTLTEDGRPQTIRSLTRDSSLPFRLGLLVDTSRGLMAAMESERKAADKFIDTMLPPADASAATSTQAFLIHFDREVELLEDFTVSREKLHKEIEEMGPAGRGSDDRGGPETTGDDRERPRGGPSGKQLYDAIYLASSEVIKPGFGARNALILFSDGVDRGSKESLNDAIDAADKANVVIYTICFKGEQQRSNFGFPTSGSRGGSRYPGGGGGYPGGGGGYPGGGSGREEKPSIDGKKIMQQIAARTGGRFFEAKKKDNLDEIYGLIAQELRGQYLLTYTPDKPDSGDYHKIALKCGKDGFTVDVREGYYAPGADAK